MPNAFDIRPSAVMMVISTCGVLAQAGDGSGAGCQRGERDVVIALVKCQLEEAVKPQMPDCSRFEPPKPSSMPMGSRNGQMPLRIMIQATGRKLPADVPGAALRLGAVGLGEAVDTGLCPRFDVVATSTSESPSNRPCRRLVPGLP